MEFLRNAHLSLFFELQMGAHRFTFLEKNLVVAATDLPDSDDRDKQAKPPAEHYSKTHVKVSKYAKCGYKWTALSILMLQGENSSLLRLYLLLLL